MADAMRRAPPFGATDNWKLETDVAEDSSSDAARVISIGQVCREIGATLRSVRFYEHCALVSPRRQGRNRFYSPQDVERLRTILKLKSFGLSLREFVSCFTRLVRVHGLTAELCETLIDRLRARKAAIDTALHELQNF